MYLWGYQVLKSIGDTLVTACDEIIYVMKSAATKMAKLYLLPNWYFW